MYSNKHPTNYIFLSPYCKLRNLVFSARFMNPNQEKKSFLNLQYGSWTRLVISICWSTLREAGDAEGIPTNVLGALHNGGYRDNPHPAIVLSKLLYGLLVMQLVFLVKRRHTSVRHYIHRLSSKRPISFLINSRKDVDHSIRRFHPSCEESSARPRKKSTDPASDDDGGDDDDSLVDNEKVVTEKTRTTWPGRGLLFFPWRSNVEVIKWFVISLTN